MNAQVGATCRPPSASCTSGNYHLLSIGVMPLINRVMLWICRIMQLVRRECNWFAEYCSELAECSRLLFLFVSHCCPWVQISTISFTKLVVSPFTILFVLDQTQRALGFNTQKVCMVFFVSAGKQSSSERLRGQARAWMAWGWPFRAPWVELPSWPAFSGGALNRLLWETCALQSNHNSDKIGGPTF